MAGTRQWSRKLEYWLSDEGIALIRGWALDGLTVKQIAKDKMGVGESTLHTWKSAHKELYDALKKSGGVADNEVEASLYKKCTGYWQKITEPIKVKKKHVTETGEVFETEAVEMVERNVYYPPDTTAIIFWMKCRKKWNDRVVEEGADNKPVFNIICDIPKQAPASVAPQEAGCGVVQDAVNADEASEDGED